MNLIAINVALIEVIALPFVAIILGATIYFFLKSRESLRSLEQQRKASANKITEPVYEFGNLRSYEEPRPQKIKQADTSSRTKTSTLTVAKKNVDENMVHEMKSTISQQQKLLSSYLLQVEEMEQEGKEEMRRQTIELERTIDLLKEQLQAKDEEINEIHEEAQAAKNLNAKIEEVYEEFDRMQEKMALMEKQANRANNLAMELEDTKNAYEQVHKELSRKQDKLEEILTDNQRMRSEMNELEDKLSEANLQRQQLSKKIVLLQEMNDDMQSLSESNKKMQTELRRIGELESMLNMMAQERDFLLKKRNENRSGL